jgi:DNA-binding CsgD family transcriptional regulator
VQAQVLLDRYEKLSRQEREVFGLVISGRLNKQVAGELGISEITVKAHRGRVMRKMQARCLVDLVVMASKLGATPAAVEIDFSSVAVMGARGLNGSLVSSLSTGC